MFKVSEKDRKFIEKAAIWSILIMAFMHVLNAWITPPDPKAEEIKALAQKVEPIRATDIKPMFAGVDGKPVMLVVYASWCGNCRVVMPRIAELIREGRLEHIHPLFISVDTNFISLSRYLVHGNYVDITMPYYALKQSSSNDLKKAVADTGGRLQGFIPYIAFFDLSGKPVAEFSGIVDKSALLQAAEQLKTERK